MKVRTGLQTGYNPVCSELARQCQYLSHFRDRCGSPALPGEELTLALTLCLCPVPPLLFCHADCQVLARKQPSPARTAAHASEGGCHALMGTWNTQGPLLCKCSCTLLPCQPQCPDCHSSKGWRSLKDRCLDENLYFLLSLLSAENPFLFGSCRFCQYWYFH